MAWPFVLLDATTIILVRDASRYVFTDKAKKKAGMVYLSFWPHTTRTREKDVS
jgi:hypothetical protein